jgi:hypothetical protein
MPLAQSALSLEKINKFLFLIFKEKFIIVVAPKKYCINYNQNIGSTRCIYLTSGRIFNNLLARLW